MRVITDTHPLIWHLARDRRLSEVAKQLFLDADQGLGQVLIPGIVLIEMVYLVEKGVLAKSRLQQVLEALEIPNGSYAVASLDQITAQTMLEKVPWSLIPELADRINAATAIALDLPLLSKDQKHQELEGLQTVW